jgi:hypothetical protein
VGAQRQKKKKYKYNTVLSCGLEQFSLEVSDGGIF